MKHAKIIIRAAVGGGVLTLAAGCASGPPFRAPEPAPADRAQVYIYRPMVLAGGGTAHKVTIDGKAETLSLPNASWQRVILAPGTHSVGIKDFFGVMSCMPQPLLVSLEAGATAYVANIVKTSQGIGALFIGCTTERRPADQALKDLVGLSGAQ